MSLVVVKFHCHSCRSIISLYQPSALANNLSAFHWQITFYSTSSKNCSWISGLLLFFIDFRCLWQLSPALLAASLFSHTLVSVYWQLGMLKGSMKKKWLGQEFFFSCVLWPCLIPIPFPADFWERLPQSSVSNSVLQNDCPF